LQLKASVSPEVEIALLNLPVWLIFEAQPFFQRMLRLLWQLIALKVDNGILNSCSNLSSARYLVEIQWPIYQKMDP